MLSTRDKLDGKVTRLDDKTEKHSALQNYDPEGGFFYIDLSMIFNDPNQPRKHFDPDSLSELCQSIRKNGVLQPVLIRKDAHNKLWLIAGERRYRAARMAGIERIPAILTEGNPQEIALIENLQREGLKPIEEAEALDRLATDCDYTHENLSEATGKARSTITEILSLNKLPEVIKSECRSSNGYPRRLLVEIARCETEDEMVHLFESVKKGQFKSDHIRSVRKGRSDMIKESLAMTITNKSRLLSKLLSRLDLCAIDAEEREQLFDELTGLKEDIDRMFQNVGAPT